MQKANLTSYIAITTINNNLLNQRLLQVQKISLELPKAKYMVN
jgi:hypothetical protein